MFCIAIIMAIRCIVSILPDDGQKFPIIRKIPNYSFKNVHNQAVTFNDMKGKVKVIYFYFTHCPTVCPIATHLLSRVQAELKQKKLFGSRAAIVSISFDSERDNKQNVEAFAHRFDADYTGWYFLNGAMEETIRLAKESFQILIQKDKQSDFIHMNVIALVDADNNLRKLYNANKREEVTPAAIAQDIAALIPSL